MQVVSPYRPSVPESTEHHILGPFDWVGATRMLAESVRQSNGCSTYVITDEATVLPVPSIQLPTTEARLMLWILDVSLRFLESDRFDQDTVFISPDTLVLGSLEPYFVGDLGVVVRPQAKYSTRPIINSVQWWPVAAKDKLISFYQRVLAIGRTLDEPMVTWGGDSEPIRRLLMPIEAGLSRRRGLKVQMWSMTEVMTSLLQRDMDDLDAGRTPQRATAPIVDFRYTRKRYMPAYYQAMCQPVAVSQ